MLQATRRKCPGSYSYSLKGYQLEKVTTTKYLGVDMSKNLLWKAYIYRIVKKANSTLGFLQRNLRISNTDTKAAAYSALVQPTLDYFASKWSTHTELTKHIWKWCKRRYCTNRYHNTSSVTEMLGDLQWETFESRRTKIQLTMLFKIVNDLVDIPAEEYLSPARTRTRALHVHSKRLSSIWPNQIHINTASFQGHSWHGTLNQLLQQRPLTWYTSNRGCLTF